MLDWSQAIESLQAATDIAPVHVLVGTDFILSRWYLDKLEHVLASVEHMPGDVNRFRFDEEGCAGAVQACQTLSLFSDTGIVHLDHCSAFLSGGKSKHDLTDLERYLEHPASGKVLVITVHGEKLDERKKIVKLARKHTVVNCNPPKENVALQWLATVCEERGISLANEAAPRVVAEDADPVQRCIRIRKKPTRTQVGSQFPCVTCRNLCRSLWKITSLHGLTAWSKDAWTGRFVSYRC